MHVQFNFLSDYAESLKLISVIFLLQVIENGKLALSEEMNNTGLRTVSVSREHHEVNEETGETQRKGAPSYSTGEEMAMTNSTLAETDDCMKAGVVFFLRQC